MDRSPTDRELLERMLHLLQQNYVHVHQRLLQLEQAMLPKPGDPGSATPPRPSFTAQQLTYIRLACDRRELTVEQIADEMGIRPCSVQDIARAVYKKLNAHSRHGMVRAAMELGLLDL